MKPYRELTRIGQLRRSRVLARTALESYGLSEARLTFLRYFANIVYRIDLPVENTLADEASLYAPDRFLLRILLSNNWEYALGELAWLAALSEAGLTVPAPVRNQDGALLMRVQTPGIPEGRIVSVMRWIQGRKLPDRLSERHYHAWGHMVGQLHSFAKTWKPPAGFQRFTWDWDGLLGGNGFNSSIEELVASMPEHLREPFRLVSQQTKTVMASLGNNPDAYGMIHGDMYADNVLLNKGRILPIDFEDCGFGYWLWDIANALGTDPWTDDWFRLRDAFLTGYDQTHHLQESQLKHLNLFLAAQYATGVLWASQFMIDDPGRKSQHENWRKVDGARLLRYMERI